MKAILYLGNKLIAIPIVHLYCPIQVKFDTRDLHIILLSVCEFPENQRGEGRSSLKAANEFCIYACTLKLYDTWKAKNVLVTSVYHATDRKIGNLAAALEN
jgi:hypothetical protein